MDAKVFLAQECEAHREPHMHAVKSALLNPSVSSTVDTPDYMKPALSSASSQSQRLTLNQPPARGKGLGSVADVTLPISHIAAVGVLSTFVK